MTVHDVKTPLFQFCRLVREGKIPRGEVRRLVEKYSKTKEELRIIFERVLRSVRKEAEEVSDLNIKASVCVIIAGFSHSDEDINAALESIGKISDGLKHQTLAVLAKTLAEAGKISKAWKIIPKIGGDQYWVTMAILFIACVTESQEDFKRAKLSARHINGQCAREEALADIKYAEAHKKNRSALLKRASNQREGADTVNHLVKALISLNDFDEAHETALKAGSAKCRIEVLSIIGHALSQLI